MKFLCLAYGDEDGWKSLSQRERQEALAHDATIRALGNPMAAVQTTVTSVRNWGGKLDVQSGASMPLELPLAGFSVIEAESLERVIELVSNTPCARARGVIEIRPLLDENAESGGAEA